MEAKGCAMSWICNNTSQATYTYNHNPFNDSAQWLENERKWPAGHIIVVDAKEYGHGPFVRQESTAAVVVFLIEPLHVAYHEQALAGMVF